MYDKVLLYVGRCGLRLSRCRVGETASECIVVIALVHGRGQNMKHEALRHQMLSLSQRSTFGNAGCFQVNVLLKATAGSVVVHGDWDHGTVGHIGVSC